MARTNASVVQAPVFTHEGGRAMRIAPQEDLLRAVSTCLLFEDTFYESGNDIAARITALVGQSDPAEVARVARLARTDLKLRSVPLWLAVQMAIQFSGRYRTADVVRDVIQRPDELAEAIALYWKAAGRSTGTVRNTKLPRQLKVGIAEAFAKFDEYRLAKWDRQDREVKLKDALFLSHPKPVNDEQDALWKRLVAGTLVTPDTWEVAYSAARSVEEKRAIWERLIAERKLGAMATLMNLRNMGEVNVPMATVQTALGNIDKRSKLLPFRFVAAAKFAPQYAADLSEAMIRSLGSMGKLRGKTVLVIDNSGSMTGGTISSRSKLDRADAAGALAVLLREVTDEVRVFVYGTDVAEVKNVRGLPLVDAIKAGPGGGTNTAGALTYAAAKVPDAERVILITDEQAHDGIVPNWAEKGYLVNVAPYAPGLDTSGKWQRINGWSDRLVDWIAFNETGRLLTDEPEE